MDAKRSWIFIVQQAESLMGLFYLLTLYGFSRYAGSEWAGIRWRWALLSVVACLLGMATAEMNLGSALLELGRLDVAEAHYLAALRLDPRMDDARANLARVRAAGRR